MIDNDAAHESWIDRVELIAAGILQFGILLVTLGALWRTEWRLTFSGSIVLLLTLAPVAG